MSESTPPLRYNDPAPPPKRRFGCLGCLVVFIVFIGLAIFGVRYAFLHTALPFRFFAHMIEKANPKVRIDGISGDLLTGPRVHSITWGEDGSHPTSELTDLRIRYSSLGDIRARKELIIEDAGVARAHIDLADFGDWKSAETSSSTSSTTSRSSSSSSGTHTSYRSSSSTSSQPMAGTDLQSFEIRQILIQDVLITNRDSPSFRLSIPKVSWKGFKVTRQEGTPGDLEIESDRLTVHTKPGRTLPLGDQKVAFDKTVDGVLQPLAYDGLLQPIHFVWDVSVSGEMKSASHLSLADGQIESWSRKDKQRHVSIRHLDLTKLIDPHKIYGQEAADLPTDVNLEADATAEDADLKTISGNVRVGLMNFTIEPKQAVAEDEGGPASLRATHEEGGQKIIWVLPTEHYPWQYQPTFQSEPEMDAKELLARVFHGKPYDSLSPEEKEQVERREGIYFPPEQGLSPSTKK